MFVGHYSCSYAGKALDRTIPLWVLFVAVQFLDFVWSVLILLGIEHVRIIPGFMAASALDLYDMPYSHSLVGALALSIMGGILSNLVWKKSGLIVGLAVFSHWILDLVVHAPDLVLYGSHKVGFGLWNYFWPEFVIEIGLLLVTMLWYLSGVSSPIAKRRVWILFGILIAFQCVDKFGPPPGSAHQAAGSALAAYTVLAALAAWTDKKTVA
jgi:hypothetical protein